MERLVCGLIEASVRYRVWVVILVFVGSLVGAWSAWNLEFDAFPDLTSTQVQVVTASPGMNTSEVEQLVTVPIERALGGIPRVETMRSLSRTGISSITVVFRGGTDPWMARQWVNERLVTARSAIPPTAGVPELGPMSTGLGEVFQFTVRSDRHTAPQLYRVFERDIAPRMRTVPGIVEVNAWGGGTPELHVEPDPYRLAAAGITLIELRDAVQAHLGRESGGAIVQGAEQRLVSGLSEPNTPEAMEQLVIRRDEDGRVIRVGDVATVRERGAMTVGLGSSDARGESLFVMTQLLAGADALKTTAALKERFKTIKGSLPDGVELEVIYARDKLVLSTLHTVAKSLLEGGVLVIIILLILLGDLRAGLLVATVIPLSMLGAFSGMRLLGFSGNLMSLGAIDFGLVVDGAVVITESIVALELAKQGHLGEAIVERAQRVAGSVLYAVIILMVVYTPILAMWGTEGKLFRPMALTVLLAIGTALVLTFTYIPAMASWVIRPRGDHQTALIRALSRIYEPALQASLRRPRALGALVALIFIGSVGLGGRLGLEFVPRLEEGDLVVQTTRLPSLNPEEALRGATRVEAAIATLPEVERVASRTGAPALATDPMGLEEADILVRLKPRDQWTTAKTTEGLVAELSRRLKIAAPDAQLNFTQPIEMRFNELLEGITGDVGVKIYGPELDELLRISSEVSAALKTVPGAADIATPSMEGVPGLKVTLDHRALVARQLPAEELLPYVAAVQRGVSIGEVKRGQFRDAVVLRFGPDRAGRLIDLPVPVTRERSVPLGELANVRETTTPVTIEREEGSRRFIVEVNVRGRDLGGFVKDAQRAVGAVKLPPGYWIEWGGKYEQLRAAGRQMTIMIPAVILLICMFLFMALRSWRATALIFLNVPVAVSGGVFALWSRGLPWSMSAIVGCIALFGIAVMNGVVLISRTRELHGQMPPLDAALMSAQERLRPVLTTALVAALGFVPMALATGVGAEVQRPLATVVLGGLVTSTLLTLLVLPSLYVLVYRKGQQAHEERAEGDD